MTTMKIVNHNKEILISTFTSVYSIKLICCMHCVCLMNVLTSTGVFTMKIAQYTLHLVCDVQILFANMLNR